jgi:hypothetical protein
MEKILSSAALHDNQRDAKDAAYWGVVRDIGVETTLARGAVDVEAGRFVEGTDAAHAAVAKRRKLCAIPAACPSTSG